MGKDNTKNLVGQPIFKQIIKMIPKDRFDALVVQQKSDKGYRTFFTWEQLMVMLFGIFSRCDSMGEVCDGMRALEGKLNCLGLDCSPAKSTAGDALRERDNAFSRVYTLCCLPIFVLLCRSAEKRKR